MGLAGKVQILVFPNLKLCFHDTTLEAYLHRYVCTDHMVDGALKTMRLAVWKHDSKKNCARDLYRVKSRKLCVLTLFSQLFSWSDRPRKVSKYGVTSV